MNTLQLILWDLDTQSTQGYYKKRKLHANLTYEYRCKTSKNSKLNPTGYKKIIS